MDEEHEYLRKTLWVQVAVAVARAENAVSPHRAATWADIILDSFDKKFKKEETKTV